MLVKDFMTRHPILINASMPATQAQKIMVENRVRHLPVTGNGKRLQGLVTRQSLKLDAELISSLDVWQISNYLANLQAKHVMIPAEKVITIGPEKTAERAACVMYEHKVGCLPVVEDGDVVVGILSEVDLLNVFQEMMALAVDGVRITLRMPNRKGEFAKLANTISQHEFGVMGIGTYPTPRGEGTYDAVLKLRNATLPQVEAAFQGIEDYEIIDIREIV